ncbi:cysteine hydrolase family protein [Agrococcus sp. HG114]|uniref:cysteine hydrolase family protein n=1 Tax=Agrococcus sp. HG114 TaxID=2969757 RepID=UPI00215A3A5E|nr:cysteine hydrolase family protein [Agrococcus sp. HG114]MCR8671967.1 cysteine hydrolase [Agrococcus sp. HG114]
MTTALIVIDVQESFRRQPQWHRISKPGIAADVARLVAHARAAGDPVLWVLHAEPGSGGAFDPEQGGVRLIDGLEAIPGEPVLVKRVHNAFTTTDLQEQLDHRGVDAVRLAGIRTEQCVETTARLASDLGYRVEVVLDATATHPLALHDGAGELSAAEVIARTAAALAGRFATITTIDAVLGADAAPASERALADARD